MKYFFDTEFIEWAGGIQLVSIGIVREDGWKFYAESCMFDERLADQWVKENVISKLKINQIQPLSNSPYSAPHCLVHEINSKATITWESNNPDDAYEYIFGTELFIRTCLLEWFGDDDEPEFYAYYASYDWVVFCRIFGRMIDLPKHFPMYVIDIKQMMHERGLGKKWKQEVCPDPEGEHNALVDAEWNKKLYDLIPK